MHLMVHVMRFHDALHVPTRRFVFYFDPAMNDDVVKYKIENTVSRDPQTDIK